jgi:hypothetical protein
MIFDAAKVPGDGPITASTPLILCQYINGAGDQPEGSQSFDWTSHPLLVNTGLAIAVSVNAAACGALTQDGPNNWFSAQMQ